MPDYGHPIRFGSFITPVNSPASAPVRLALLSEELGLDLVTFQDHPYQPSFLDTWTLLSWGQGEPHSHSGLVRHLSPDVAAAAAALLETGASYFFAIRSVGGAVSDVPADATAYGWREANFSVAAFGTRASGLDPGWDKLVPHLEGMYLSFETATGPEVLARAFPPDHLTRLRALKRRYDPTGLFRDNFYIDPGSAA